MWSGRFVCELPRPTPVLYFAASKQIAFYSRKRAAAKRPAERRHALAFDFNGDFEGILAENSGALYMQAFMKYMLGFAMRFRKCCKPPNIDIKKDLSGFSLSHISFIRRKIDGAYEKYFKFHPYRGKERAKRRAEITNAWGNCYPAGKIEQEKSAA